MLWVEFLMKNSDASKSKPIKSSLIMLKMARATLKKTISPSYINRSHTFATVFRLNALQNNV